MRTVLAVLALCISCAAQPTRGGGGGTPGGSNGQVQINNNGAFGGLAVGTGLASVAGSLQYDSSVIPLKSSTNTWTSGDKQSMSASSTTAPLNLGPGASLPSIPATGDLTIDAVGQLNWYDGSGWREGAYNAGSNSNGLICGSGNAIGPCSVMPSNLSFTTPTLTSPTIASAVNTAWSGIQWNNGTPNTLSCGSGSAFGTGASDNAGIVTIGGATTTCSFSFGASFANTPSCYANYSPTNVVAYISSLSVSAITITLASSESTGTISYRCF